MKRLLVREGYSPANDTNLFGVLGSQYGDNKAFLSDSGEDQALILPKRISEKFPEYDLSQPVATSRAVYCMQTARIAGFKYVPYELLDNPLGGPKDIKQINESVNKRFFLPEIVDRFKRLLDSPPEERILIMSGYVDAGVCALLGLYGQTEVIPDTEEHAGSMRVTMEGSEYNFMPYNAEIREVDF
jgi:hypothetical protein